MVMTTYSLTDLTDAELDRLAANVTYAAVGTGTTAPTSADTALQTEVLRKAVELVTRDDPNGKITIDMHILSTEANGSTLTEIGLFDAAAAGNMYLRGLITPITKNSSTEAYISCEITNTVTGD